MSLFTCASRVSPSRPVGAVVVLGHLLGLVVESRLQRGAGILTVVAGQPMMVSELVGERVGCRARPRAVLQRVLDLVVRERTDARMPTQPGHLVLHRQPVLVVNLFRHG